MDPARGGRLAGAVVRVEVGHGWAELVADADRPSAWTLLIDGTAQSHVDLADPTHLEFEYVRRTGHLLDALDPAPPAPLRVLHLGGGAWTLPRYVAATRPGSAQRVVELDGALVDLVRARLPADGLGLDVHVADARAGLTEVPPGSCDVVLLDVYAGARIPAHLTSVEFLQQVARVLRPGGCYAANLADGTGARTLAAPADPARLRPRAGRDRRGRVPGGGGRRGTGRAARPPVRQRRARRRWRGRPRAAAGTRWPGGWRRTRSRPASSRARPSPRRPRSSPTGRPSPHPGPRGACSGSERGPGMSGRPPSGRQTP